MSPPEETEELPLKLPDKEDLKKIKDQGRNADKELWEGTILERMVKRRSASRPSLKDLEDVREIIELDEKIEEVYPIEDKDMSIPELYKKITDISEALKNIEKKVDKTTLAVEKHEAIPEDFRDSFWGYKPRLKDWIKEWRGSDNEAVQKAMDFAHASKYKELEQIRHEYDKRIREKGKKEKDIKNLMKKLAENEPDRLKYSHLIDLVLGIDYSGTEKKFSERDTTEKELEEKTNLSSWRGKDSNMTPYTHIQNFLEELNLNENDVFYDLGSGYGRPVFYSALTTDVKKAVGIEIVPERVENCKKIKEDLKLDNVEFRQGNVLDHDFSDGTVFFLFNPFNEKTEKKIKEKLKEVDHDFKVVTWHTNLDNEDWLNKKKEVVAGTNPIRIYRRKQKSEENKEI